MDFKIDWIIDFSLRLATKLVVSIFVNFMNHDEKRLPWKNGFIFAVGFTLMYCAAAFVLEII